MQERRLMLLVCALISTVATAAMLGLVYLTNWVIAKTLPLDIIVIIGLVSYVAWFTVAYKAYREVMP